MGGAPQQAKKKLVIEGWRSICHSYAVVNQWLSLALLKRDDVALRTRDAPFFNPNWRRVDGLFDPAKEAALKALPLADADARPDATLRITFPYNVVPAQHGRTAIWATSEINTVPLSYLSGTKDVVSLAQDPRFMVIAPSHWSAQGFLRLGLRPEQVPVIPAGIDTEVYRPDAASRGNARRELRLGGFVFLSVGAMTANKGMDVLLRAFARVAQKHPDVKLILKGADDLYNSKAMLQACLPDMPAHERAVIASRLIYFGNTFSFERMATLYRVADAYVAPYRAEGFNVPVLEAVASGLPVICTSGGPTDDFVNDSFARKIRSRLVPVNLGADIAGQQLEPDAEHFTELMFDVVENAAWRSAAAAAGPRHIAQSYTWDHVAKSTTDALFGPN